MVKASDEQKDRFRALVPDGPGVQVKPLFGQLGAYVNGNMFAGLYLDSIGVKLDDASRAELAALDGAGPFSPGGKQMGSYLALPPTMTPGDATGWLRRARDHVATFPPKG
jgi:TfoX/Sxy family transcriptional regulator of competence genes